VAFLPAISKPPIGSTLFFVKRRNLLTKFRLKLLYKIPYYYLIHENIIILNLPPVHTETNHRIAARIDYPRHLADDVDRQTDHPVAQAVVGEVHDEHGEKCAQGRQQDLLLFPVSVVVVEVVDSRAQSCVLEKKFYTRVNLVLVSLRVFF